MATKWERVEFLTNIFRFSINHFNLADFSMGMSNHSKIAIAEGGTMIRVGTAIFGRRIYPDSYYWNENLTVITKL